MSEPLPENRLTLSTLAAEPFRVWFPLAVLTGMLGVLLWPAYFAGWLEQYPGPGHTRLMGQGFFGGFIFGFLGTALPRMLSAPPFRIWQWAWLLALFGVFVTANVAGSTWVGDAALLVVLVSFVSFASVRVLARRDVPPPGFVLVGLAFICGITGTIIGLLDHRGELDFLLLALRPLLAYQGFVLLPVLGVGAFILPKLLGLRNQHDFPGSLNPPPGWWPKALFALVTGLAIISCFAVEVNGWFRTAHAMRFLAVAVYLGRELPLQRAAWRGNAIHWSLRAGLLMVLLGLLAVVILPAYRVGLLHILLVGGLGVITIVVATRVVFGHSGNAPLLSGPNRWMWWVTGLILLGMATRITGDFLPRIMVTHYNYGALCWVLGMGLWAWKVLPKVRVPDRD